MSGQMITYDRVLALIETYGADPDMFPEAERAADRIRARFGAEAIVKGRALRQ